MATVQTITTINLQPAPVDICITRGDNTPIKFILKNASGVIDITGYSFLLTVDPEPDPANSSANLFQLTGVITDMTNGAFEFRPTTTNTDQTPGTYFFDLQVTDDAGVKLTWAKGKFVISQDISK